MEASIDILLRTAIGYVALLLLTRLMGRKQVSHLTFFDYVTGITIGSITASLVIDNQNPAWTGLLALAGWTVLLLATDVVVQKFVPARKLLSGEPLMVIYDGQILEENLAQQFYNINNLLLELRMQGIFDPNEVAVAVFETNGQLSVLKKAQFLPLTPQTAGGTPDTGAARGYSVGKEVIIDGTIITANLQSMNLSEDWLDKQLRAQGLNDASQVTIAFITPDGALYIDKKKDSAPANQRRTNWS